MSEYDASVACIELVRLMPAISISKSYATDQIYIKGALLNASLTESNNIWIRVQNISGISYSDVRLFNLFKYVYGLNNAPELWYQLLPTTIYKIGFPLSQYCHCFFCGTKPNPIEIVEYVDDLLVIGNSRNVEAAKTNISKKLTITDLGPCSYFLGTKI